MTIAYGSDADRLGSGNSAGIILGNSASDTINPGKVAFYGNVPVVQRPYSSAVHATSAQAVSASFGATQLATLQEIQKTLIGLGVWATV
jgi:hypothetical protein